MQSCRRRSVCTVARAVSPAPSTSPRLGDEYGWAVVWGPGRWGAAGSRDSEVVPVWAQAAPPAPAACHWQWAVRHLCWSAVVLKVLSNLAAGLRGGTHRYGLPGEGTGCGLCGGPGGRRARARGGSVWDRWRVCQWVFGTTVPPVCLVCAHRAHSLWPAESRAGERIIACRRQAEEGEGERPQPWS
jgi:hypothetical protein